MMSARIFTLELRRLRVKPKYDPKEFHDCSGVWPLKELKDKAWLPQALETRDDVVTKFISLARADVLQAAQPAECPQCHQIRPKRSIEAHMKQDCHEREEACAFYGKMFHVKNVDELKQHHDADCSEDSISCPYKGYNACFPIQAEAHRKFCKMIEEDCKFGAIGCKSKVRRGQLGQHYRNQAPNHVELLEKMMVEAT